MTQAMTSLLTPTDQPETGNVWRECRFLSCSVLPVRVACNLNCPFCFSKSSISALRHERVDWREIDVEHYYDDARNRGATRLVITGGGEPLLRPDVVVDVVKRGKRVFDEVALFTNGTYLTAAVARQLAGAGLSYVCYSRHATDDGVNRALMGPAAPGLAQFFQAAGPLKVRATCVMAQGYVDSRNAVWRHIDVLRSFGVTEFTFKHTYVAYAESLFQGTTEDEWSRARHVDFDPFANEGEVVGSLPWGPKIRHFRGVQVCYYHEPTPQWEQQNRLCRSSNLLSDGAVYASLEDRRSLLYRLTG